MEDQGKQVIIRAKQAILPTGLANQSAEGTSGPGSQIDPDDLVPDDLDDAYMEGEKPGANVRVTHLTRNPNPKPNIDKPSYS